ncbi:ScbA/BarX family gamma-butyrolactone biosynthesis protein [Streptomyces sp. NPDC046215]|uniref:ScbA/BarX family gamma-butyrolactone biosynthesis protein n=1 Tax=Streptomyces stramineus TaxID=173861 RepID=A0ABN1AJ15_9ACTN
MTQTLLQPTTVAPALVHLGGHPENVVCTGWDRHDDDRFTVTALWPAGTARHIPGHGTHCETLVAAQTIRQAALLLAHAEFAAPLAHAVLLRTFNFTLDPACPLPEDEPAALDIHVTATPTATRGTRVTGVHLAMTLHHGPHVVGTADTAFEWIPPTVYRRLRGTHAEAVSEQPPLPAPLPPAGVGRRTAAEVLLSPTSDPRQWLLRHPFANTVLYDHPVDHVPGLVLIEAAHQAVRHLTQGHHSDGPAGLAGRSAHNLPLAPAFHPTTTHTTFHTYVEFDQPCTLTHHSTHNPLTHSTIHHVYGHQDGRPVFHTILSDEH